MGVPTNKGLVAQYHVDDGYGAKLVYSPDFTTKVIYDVSNRPIYIGKAAPGTLSSATGWQIKQITYDGNGNATDPAKFAGGTDAPVNVMDNYLSYSYS